MVDQPAGAPRPAPARPRRRRLLRLATGLAALLLLLHTPPARLALKAALERLASRTAHGRVQIAQLDYRLWAGQARLSSLRLERPGLLVEVERLDLGWSPGGGLTAALLRPRVEAWDEEGPAPAAPPPSATGLRARPWGALGRLAAASVQDGRVEVATRRGQPWLVLGGLEAQLTSRGAARAVVARVREGGVGQPGDGLPLAPLTVEARLTAERGQLTIEEARLAGSGAGAELRGTLERLQPFEGALDLQLAAEAGALERFAPGLRASGRLEGQARLTFVQGLPRGPLSVRSAALVVSGLGPWSASLSGRVDGARLVLEAAEARGYGGRLALAGDLALDREADTALRLQADGLDLAALVEALGGGRQRLAARAGASFAWSTRGWDLAAARGEGRVALLPGRGAGLPLAGEARLRSRGGALELEAARLQAQGLELRGQGSLDPRGGLAARWEASLPVPALALALAELGLDAPRRALEGELLLSGEVSGSTAAPVTSARLGGRLVSTRGHALGLDGELRLAGGRLLLSPATLRDGSGEAHLAGRVPLRAGETWDVDGQLEALDCGALLDTLGLPGGGPVSGRLSITGPSGQPRSTADLAARLALPGAPEPVAVSLAASGHGRRLQVESLDADVAGGHVTGSGSFDGASGAIEARLSAQGLRAGRLPLRPEALSDLDGVLGLELQLSGSAAAPVGQARATLSEGRLGEAALPALELTAEADGRRLALAGRADQALLLEGASELAGDWPAWIEVDTARLPLQALLEAWPQARELEGRLSAEGRLRVELPLRQPEALRYSARGLVLTGGYRDRDWRSEPFDLSGDRAALELPSLRLSGPQARLEVSGRAPLRADGAFDLKLAGQLALAGLEGLTPVTRAAGELSLELALAGTPEDPDLTGRLSLTGGRGRLGGLRWRDVGLEARLLGGQVEIEQAGADLLGGRLALSGRFPLRPVGKGPPTRLTFELRDVDLGPLLAPEEGRPEPAASLVAALEGQLEATGPALGELSLHGRLSRLDWRSPDGQMALAAPVGLSLARGRAALEGLRWEGSLGRVEARAQAQLLGPRPTASGALAGSLDLAVLNALLDESTSLAGATRLDLRWSRDAEGLQVEGQADLQGGRVTFHELAFSATPVDGRLAFEGRRVSLQASGAVGEGRLKAEGEMQLGPALLGPADLRLELERVPVAYPEGFRGRASGSLRLVGDGRRYRVEGDVGLAQSLYTAETDARRQSLDRLTWQLAALRGGTVSEKLPLAVNVRLVEPVRVRNSRLELDLVGALQVAGTLAQPVATGQISLREGGQLTIARGRVRIDQGRVELNGYPQGTPEVDLAGTTRVSGVFMSLRARGPLDDLELSVAAPERADLGQTDLLTLLLTGRTASAAASDSGTIVAEQLAVALGSSLQKGVGEALMIDVSPDRSLLADDTDPTQRLNVGHRIGDNLFVIYSTALDGTEQRIILDFQPRGGRLRLRFIDEQDQSETVELTDRFSIGLRRRADPGAQRDVARLAALRFEGRLPLPEEELRKAAGLRVGRSHSGVRRQQAAEKVRLRLVARGWPSALVDDETRPVGGRAVELVLNVSPGPRVRLAWTGDDPGGKLRERVQRAWPALATPEMAAAQLARACLVSLQAGGHYEARVEPAVSSAPEEVTVTLRVTLGPRGRGVDLRFEGARALGERALRAALPAPGSREFFEALNGRGAGLAELLRLRYAGAGHLQARVGAPRRRFDPATGRLEVVIPLREGPASQVASVDLPAELQRPDVGPAPQLKLAAGQPFDLSAYVADREALAAWFRQEGWPEAEVRGVLAPRDGRLAVAYVAQAGPRPVAGRLRLERETRTRRSLVERLVTVEEGDLLRPRDLSESRERLSELAVYRSVDVRGEPRADDPGVRDVLVNLVDEPELQVEYGLRYTTEGTGGAGSATSSADAGKLQFGGAVGLGNLFGLGWRLRTYATLTTERQAYGLWLDNATFLGRRLRTQARLFDDSDDDIQISGLASRVRGLTLEQSRVLRRDYQSRRWHDRLRLQWGYAFKKIRYVSSEREGEIAGDRGYVTLALVGDERDSLTDPHRGVFWSLGADLAADWLGSEAQYAKTFAQFFAYLPLGRKLTWAQGYRLGVAPGDDPLLLLEDRFRAGGASTVRGFPQNFLGPQTAEGDSVGGQALVVLNQELRFPIWKQLQGGLFYDAGNVYALSRQMQPGHLRHSAGAGLRYVFAFGPVRLEYAWVIDPRPGEARGRVVFALGHAF